MHIADEEKNEAHAQVHVHVPRARENMVRAHFHLRPDQIEFLDGLAEASGKGVHRSDWVRHAIDRLAMEMEQRSKDATDVDAS